MPKRVLAILSGVALVIIAVFAVPEKTTKPDAINLTEIQIRSNNDSNIQTLTLDLPTPSMTKDPRSENSNTSAMSKNQLTLKVKSGDTLGEMFKKHNLSYADMLSILNDKQAKKHLTRLQPDEELLIQTTGSEGQIQNLEYNIDIENTLNIKRQSDNSFQVALEQTPLERRVAYAYGTINDSLFLAGQDAGLEDRVIMNLVGIFRWDIDFVLDIRRNDSFTVIYEQHWKNGDLVSSGNILAAEFSNDGEIFHAIRFEDENNDGNYYTPDGKSLRKAFLRAPIAFSPRVTSNFNPRRLHPVHKRVRPHRGVDYGGPRGTPILAAGDGKVTFRGRKGGYGNTVILQHGGNITTLYAHLSKFNKNAKRGKRVKQGQTIGYLGSTGTVTAKHLHYEYRVNGVHRNPRTVKLPNARPLHKKHKSAFEKIKQPLLAQLDVIKRANTSVIQKAADSKSAAAHDVIASAQ
jgi:murein DD-endopeptidase MepM/ murein hydrolase activator NlpD